MTRINETWASPVIEAGSLDDDIDSGLEASAELAYFLTSSASLGMGVTYLHGTTHKVHFDSLSSIFHPEGGVNGHRVRLTTTLIAPHLKIRYHIPRDRLEWLLGTGAVWGFGRCLLQSDFYASPPGKWYPSDYRWTAEGLGFLVFAGLSYSLNERVSFGTELGYRRFTSNDLVDGEGDAWEVKWEHPPQRMNLDFDGFFLSANLSLSL